MLTCQLFEVASHKARVAGVVVCAWLSGACGAAQATSPAGDPPRSEPAPIPHEPSQQAVWQSFAEPPSRAAAYVLLLDAEREVRFDDSLARYVRHESRAWQLAAWQPGLRLSSAALFSGGLVAIDGRGRLLLSEDGVQALTPIGTLKPTPGKPELVSYRGGLVLRQGHQVGVLSVSGTGFEVKPLPPFAERQAWDARIGADGAGVVLFSPQSVVRTREFGAQYHELSSGGVLAKELWAAGDEVLVVPGSDDGFARAVPAVGDDWRRRHAASADLKWQQPSSTFGERPRALAKPDYDRPFNQPGFRGRFSAAGWARYQVRFVEQGDRLLAAIGGGKWLTGKLGEAFEFHDSAEFLGGCVPDDLRLSHCEGVLVSSCWGQVTVRTSDGTQRPLDLGTSRKLTPVALVSGQELVVHNSDGVWLVPTDGGKSPRLLAENGAPFELAAACGSSGLVWVIPREGTPIAVGWSQSPPKQSELEDLDRKPRWPPPHWRPLAVLSDQRLLAIDERSGRLAQFAGSMTLHMHWPSGLEAKGALREWRDKPGSFAFTFNQAGRGLVIERETGRTWQTLDGARSWSRTQGAAVPSQGLNLFCTKERCELEDQRVRWGWDATPPEVAPQHPHWVDGGGPPTLQLECATDVERSPKLPQGFSSNEVLPEPGVDGASWTAAVFRFEADPGPERGYYGAVGRLQLDLLLGDELGAVRQIPISKWHTQKVLRAARLYGGQSLLLTYAASNDPQGVLSGQFPVQHRWFAAAQSKPTALAVKLGEVGLPENEWSLAARQIATSRGLALLHNHERRLIWLTPGERPETRPWYGLYREEPGVLATLARRPDGAWVVASWVGDELELVAVKADGVSLRRRLLLAEPGMSGLGLLETETGVRLFTVRGGDAGEQLVSWELSPDLGLDRPQPVSSPVPRGGLFSSLPSCGEPAPAGVMHLLARHVRVQLDGSHAEDVLLRSRLRVGIDEACIEQSWLAKDQPTTTYGGDLPVLRGVLPGPVAQRVLGVVWEPTKGLAAASCHLP